MKKTVSTKIAAVAILLLGLVAASCSSASGEHMYQRKQTNSSRVVKSNYKVSGSSRVMGTDQNLRRKSY